ncbi:hypothetical protein [Herbidospora mongoliensis]|uniref:hypothetical protein n=1 Tax=Herbidospora mongoliensis TaxID=688067 RepID=UPI000ACE564D|nr:hypothetical protein [Herbidospora mongoliensis]
MHHLTIWIPLAISVLNLATAFFGWATARIRRSSQICNRPEIGEQATFERACAKTAKPLCGSQTNTDPDVRHTVRDKIAP